MTRTLACDNVNPDAVGTASTVGDATTSDSFSELLLWDSGQGLETQAYTWTRLP